MAAKEQPAGKLPQSVLRLVGAAISTNEHGQVVGWLTGAINLQKQCEALLEFDVNKDLPQFAGVRILRDFALDVQELWKRTRANLQRVDGLPAEPEAETKEPEALGAPATLKKVAPGSEEVAA